MYDNQQNVDRHSHFSGIGKAVGYDDALREYYIVVKEHEGATERQAITFCPICGEKMPTSLRADWFDRLEEMGIDPLNDPIPDEYSNGSWWRKGGL
jgi:hypothetical protein